MTAIGSPTAGVRVRQMFASSFSKSRWKGNGGLDFVLMALSVVEIAAPGLPIPVPLGELCIILLVALAIFRPARSFFQGGVAWLLLTSIMVCYLILVSTVNDVDWFRRLTRILVLVTFFYCVATGRINLRAGIKGYLTGLAVNVPLFYAGIAPDTYGGVLTGYLGDKNIAGLVYGVSTFLGMLIIRRRSLRILLFLVGFSLVFATGSRTTMAAMVLALIWYSLAHKFNLFFKFTLAGAMIAIFYYVEERFARVAIFEDRLGSDLLRARIAAGSLEKVESGPWYGYGLSQAFTVLDDKLWLFHDSYLGLRAEGGWIFLAAVLLAYGSVFYCVARISRRNIDARIVSSAMVVLFFCALKLGEVFITPVGFFLMGLCAFVASRKLGRTPLDPINVVSSGPKGQS